MICDKIDEAMFLCDIVLIIKNDKLPINKLDLIYTKLTTKRIIFLELHHNEITYSNNKLNYMNTKNLPMLLNIGIGDWLTTYILDIYLNRFFTSRNIQIQQNFARETRMILDELKKEAVINEEIIKSYSGNVIKNNETADINVMSVNFDNMNEMFNYLDLIKNPDYVFLLIEKNYFTDTQDYIHNLQYRLNCKFDCVLYSDYISILWDEVSIPILASNDFCTSLCIEKEKVWDSIMKKIAYPENVIVIRASR